VVAAGILGATRCPASLACGGARPPSETVGRRVLDSLRRPTAPSRSDVYTPSIGRDACRDSGTRWVEPLITGNAAAPVHPNARGMDGMATVVAAAINARA
jgi:hypothetical protein